MVFRRKKKLKKWMVDFGPLPKFDFVQYLGVLVKYVIMIILEVLLTLVAFVVMLPILALIGVTLIPAGDVPIAEHLSQQLSATAAPWFFVLMFAAIWLLFFVVLLWLSGMFFRAFFKDIPKNTTNFWVGLNAFVVWALFTWPAHIIVPIWAPLIVGPYLQIWLLGWD